MSDYDLDRIIKFHLSPINVSFQTMNPKLRCKMLHNRFAGDALAKVDRLIRKRKKEISKELTDTIREKKLKRRKCMVCGRNLPFGYPYKLCQPCFEKKKFFEDFFETVDM